MEKEVSRFVVLSVLGIIILSAFFVFLYNGKFVGYVLQSGTNLILYDGETGSAPAAATSCLNYMQEVSGQGLNGTKALKATPDNWHNSFYKLYCGGGNRIDFTPYTHIEFYIRSDSAGVGDKKFWVNTWNANSNQVIMKQYIQGGVVDGSWRKVSIPLTDLKTSTWTLNEVEGLIWETDSSNRIFYVDNIMLTGGSATAPPQGPPPSNPICGNSIVESGEQCDDGNTVSGDGCYNCLIQIVQNQTQPPSTPAVPGKITVSKISSTGADLSWTQFEGATGYNVYIAPEPNLLGNLNSRILVNSLSSSTTSYTITGLAAAVDTFVRLEAVGNGSYLDGYFKTIGGPRAAISTPVREVHLVAPDILMIVLENKGTVNTPSTGTITGNTGADWQSGTWTVKRKDGTSISVTSVSRHSITVAQPGYILGYGGDWKVENPKVIDVDHRIYLKLSQEVGSPEILDISHSGTNTNAAFKLLFSDRYLETPAIQINQVGYNPAAKKRWAYFSTWLGDGGAMPLTNVLNKKAEVLKENGDLNQRTAVNSNLDITLRKSNDAFAGTDVAEINLANVPADENTRYRVRVHGVGVSWPTAVSNLALLKAYYISSRGMFHNRWCGDLSPQYTDWVRPVSGKYGRADHCEAYFTEGGIGPETYLCLTGDGHTSAALKTVMGGHHDAGDFDLRRYHVQVAQDLMRAFEVNKNAFTDNQLNIPESGNGIPDLLDEALWSVRLWEELQDTDGGVRMGVQTSRHPWGIYFANQEPLDWCTFSKEKPHTLYVAGLFAQAAYVVKPYNADKSAELQDRAIKAYSYALSSPEAADYAGWKIYPAGELYRLTGDQKYKSDFEAAAASVNSVTIQSEIYPGDYGATGGHRAMADSVMAYITAPYPKDSALVTRLTGLIKNERYPFSTISNSNEAHRTIRHPYGPYWGKQTAIGWNLDGAFQLKQLGSYSATESQDYIDALSLAADSMLGANPAGESWTTGLGSRYPMEPLHLDSLAFLKSGKSAIPGIPIYGIIEGAPNVDTYKPMTMGYYPAFGSQPMMHRYVDAKYYVVSSEFDMTVMSANVELFASLLPPGLTVPECWKPGKGLAYNSLPDNCGNTQPAPTPTPTPTPTNNAPSVNAGNDFNITLPVNTINIDASVSDDGLPNNVLTASWSKVSGAGTVTFGNTKAVDTSASFTTAGAYVLRLSVSDGSFSVTDDIKVTINAQPAPAPNPICAFTNATWSKLSAVEGDVVTLTVKGTNCNSKQIVFDIKEDDLALDENVSKTPGAVIMSSGTASAVWASEYQEDGIGTPEYYFTARLKDNSSISIQSNLLTVSKKVQNTTNTTQPKIEICSGIEPLAVEGVLLGVKVDNKTNSWNYVDSSGFSNSPCTWACKPGYIREDNNCKYNEVYKKILNSSDLQIDITDKTVIKAKTEATSIIEIDYPVSVQSLSKVSIERDVKDGSSYIIVVNLSSSINYTSKKIYLQKSNLNSNAVCVIDEDINSVDEIISRCFVMKCPGNVEGYSCSIMNATFLISGLKHSGAIEYEVVESQPGSGGSSGGGGGGGGSGDSGSSESDVDISPQYDQTDIAGQGEDFTTPSESVDSEQASQDPVIVQEIRKISNKPNAKKIAIILSIILIGIFYIIYIVRAAKRRL